MSLASLPSASFPADLCQIYWCPTQGAQDHQPLAEPFRQLSGGHTSFSTSGTLPALQTSHGEVISVPHKIITHLRKEKYNADYDLSARQGADTLAFMSLLEEKLLPVLVSVPRPPSMGGQWGRGSGIHTDTPPHPPHRLGAAWGPEAHPGSGRCTGSDLLLPSYTPNPDTYFLGRRQELCGSNPEVVRRGYALSPQLLPAWPHAAAVRGAAAAAVWGAQARGGGRAGEGGTSGTGGCCMRGAPRAMARSGSAWQGRWHCSRSRKLTWCPPIAVPGSSGMPDPSLSAPGLSEILLWRCLRCHLHARHQQTQRLRRSHIGAGTRSYPCWRGWQPWRVMPCSVALSPSSGHHLPGPHAHGPWAWLRRLKRNDLSSCSQD
uniref:Metaxin-1 isoform X2 n=1 Tax=Tursiops truncatus TaxID=9739 RepID=A0A6J3RFP8_TURTR|nr:metaxin-1 isoform X2 [Tursiops truncatus]